MGRLVTEADRRLGRVVLVADRAEAGRAEQEVPAGGRREPEPSRGEHPEEVAAREEKNVTVRRPDPPDHAVGPRSDVARRLPSGAAVAEQIPAGPLGVDLDAPSTFVGAVIPFGEVGLDLRRGAEPRQLASPDRAVQGAREHQGEAQSSEPLSEVSGLRLASGGQGDVAHARVLAGEGPRRFAMPCEVDDGKWYR